MKLPLLLSVCLVALLGSSVNSTAQSGGRLDIRLIGPWILYQDNHFKDAKGNQFPVLVVMTPGMTDITTGYQHAPPAFSMGDGYSIQTSGIYCVTFDDLCAPYNRNGQLASGSYPTAYPLEVNVRARRLTNGLGTPTNGN